MTRGMRWVLVALLAVAIVGGLGLGALAISEMQYQSCLDRGADPDSLALTDDWEREFPPF